MVKFITVEVVYALPHKQCLLTVQVAPYSTVQTVIEKSGILLSFPEIDLRKQKVGVFSQEKSLTDLVEEGDRVEIYRPLQMDPKEARKKRAEKAQSK